MESDEALQVLTEKLMNELPFNEKLRMMTHLTIQKELLPLMTRMIPIQVAEISDGDTAELVFLQGEPEDETLTLRINSQQVASVPLSSILLIVPDPASGGADLIVVEEPPLSVDAFQVHSKPVITDQKSQ